MQIVSGFQTVGQLTDWSDIEQRDKAIKRKEDIAFEVDANPFAKNILVILQLRRFTMKHFVGKKGVAENRRQYDDHAVQNKH